MWRSITGSMKMIKTLLSVCVAMVVSFSALGDTVKNSLKDGSDGYFKFPTSYIHQGKKVDIGGTLTFPEKQNQKVPLVVIVHSSDGVTFEEYRWDEFWLSNGYATFMLDFMSPRITSINDSSTWPRNGADVHDALKVLATHPQIDTDRVAIQGHSNGATVAADSASKVRTEPFFSWPADKIIPKAFILLYGGCASVMMPPTASIKDTATLYLVGREDVAADPDACLRSVEDQKRQGADIKAVVFPGVYHKFDGDKSASVSTQWGTIIMEPDAEAVAKAKKEATALLTRVFQ